MIKKLLLTILLLSMSAQLECKKAKNTDSTNSNENATSEKDTKIKWPEICKKYKNSVVQIYSYVNIFNLSDPSKTGGDQYIKVGTGFFISEDGYLLTNFHVVSQAPIIEIRIPTLGDQSFEAELVGCFPQKDIALLKITDASLQTIKELLNVDKIKPLKLGNSDKLNESQKVMCLGYPLGQRNLKTSIGNISGRESMDEIGECAQTTAPINQGNSGGPFLNEKGKVVGIATLKVEDADGIGYFIPINTVKAPLDDLHVKKIVKKVMLGVSLQPTTEETLKFLGNPTDGGVYVFDVEKKSLAEKAEIKKGDIIYEIDGFKVDRYGYIKPSWRDAKISLPDYISQLKIESIISLVIYRNGEKLSLQMQLKNEEEFAIKEFYPWLQEAPDSERIGGIVVVQFTLNHLLMLLQQDGDLRKVAKYAKTKHRIEPRVLISCIYPGSVALDYKFRSNDLIIHRVNDIEVKTVQDFRDAVLEGCKENPEYLTIETEGGFFAAIPVKNLIDEEQIIAKINYLEESALVKQLAEKY